MPHVDAEPAIVLALVPGMGITASDFRDRGLIADLDRRGWNIRTTVIDPGPEAYLDGSVEARMLQAIGGTKRLWLAGISLGCQGILRCIQAQPGIAQGALLLTPYLASTGLIAEVTRAGGLRPWASAHRAKQTAEQRLLSWLATTTLPPILAGYARQDRFADTARLLSGILPPSETIGIDGAHDWASWTTLWNLMLDRDPFQLQQTASA
jgi:hypothetical protein